MLRSPCLQEIQDLTEKADWTPQVIRDRQAELATLAVQVWRRS